MKLTIPSEVSESTALHQQRLMLAAQEGNAAGENCASSTGYAARVVISLCDRSGVMVKPWSEAGFECYCVDTAHSIRRERTEGKVHYVWGDVRTWTPPADVRGRIAVVFAFPPCTHVAVSGARDFLTKGTAMLRDSLEIFSACVHAAEWSGAPYAIENPIGKFSDHMRKPDHIFQPWQYGDLWTKKTCLWAGNGFVMPPPLHVAAPRGVTQAIWLMPPSGDRADKRGETPPGFAKAVYESNKHSCSLARAA